ITGKVEGLTEAQQKTNAEGKGELAPAFFGAFRQIARQRRLIATGTEKRWRQFTFAFGVGFLLRLGQAFDLAGDLRDEATDTAAEQVLDRFDNRLELFPQPTEPRDDRRP